MLLNYLKFFHIRRIRTLIIHVNTIQTENASKSNKLNMQILKQLKKYSQEIVLQVVFSFNVHLTILF